MNPAISQDEAADDVSAEQAARVTCANCSAQVHDEDTRILADRSVWCNDCFENDGGTCEHCDGAFSYDALSTDNSDDRYCDRCRDNGYGYFDDDEDDDENDDSGPIYSYDSTVFSVLNVRQPDPAVIHYGVEIELNTRYGRCEPAEAFYERARGLGFVKSDGSIGDGHSGIECVSVPLTLDRCRNFIGDLFPNDSLHCDAFVDSSCGMHVHVSRAPLSNAQIAKLVRFIHAPRNLAFMERLARRTLVDAQYASINHRTASWKAVYQPEHPRDVRMMDHYRYSALNLTNVRTIEFRFFASTTSVARARANVEACAALLAFCADATHCLAETERYEAFCAFVARRAKAYPNLAARLARIAPDFTLLPSPSSPSPIAV